MPTKDSKPAALNCPVRTPATARWEGRGHGEIDLTDELTATITLDGSPLLGLDLATGQLVYWPDGEQAVVLATFGVIDHATGADDHPHRAPINVDPVKPGGPPLITHAQVEQWIGGPVSNDHLRRIAQALPHSTVPEAIGTIAANLRNHDALLDAPVHRRTSIPKLVARYRAVSAQETRLYSVYPGSLGQIDAAVLSYERTRDRIRDALTARGCAELAAALLQERDSLGVLHDALADGGTGGLNVYRDRAARSTQAVDQLVDKAARSADAT